MSETREEIESRIKEQYLDVSYLDLDVLEELQELLQELIDIRRVEEEDEYY